MQKCVIYWWRRLLSFKSIPTPEPTVKSHPCLSNEWLQKHTIIMYYCFHYKFESNNTEQSVLTSSELTNEMLTVLFWASIWGKYKALGQLSVSHSWIFLSIWGFYGFCRGERKSDGTLIEWERDVNVLVAISFPHHLGREECR